MKLINKILALHANIKKWIIIRVNQFDFLPSYFYIKSSSIIKAMANPINNNENPLTPEQVAEKGQQIYKDKLKAILEPKDRGKFVIIEVESGDYFVADSMIDALSKAKEKYPNKVFHTIKVGFDGIFKMGTYAHRGFSYGWTSPK